MLRPDGIYSLGTVDEDESSSVATLIGDDEEPDVAPMGKIRLQGDSVTNLDGSLEITHLIETTFRREGSQEKGVFVDKQIPIRNGAEGYGEAFMEMLVFLDIWFDREGA